MKYSKMIGTEFIKRDKRKKGNLQKNKNGIKENLERKKFSSYILYKFIYLTVICGFIFMGKKPKKEKKKKTKKKKQTKRKKKKKKEKENKKEEKKISFSILFQISITIFTYPSARAEYDTMSVFKWSLAGLNSEFSFS